MDIKRMEELIVIYRDGLLNDTLPFWIDHGVDRECGGFLFCLDRDGTVLDTDKSLWTHGRFAWLMASLYDTVEAREEWLELSRHGIDFLRKFGSAGDGKMHYSVTREGRPLRIRRYMFTESFATIALAAYAKASGEEKAAEEALEQFRQILRYLGTPGLLPPKGVPGTRPSKALGIPMILLATAQELRLTTKDPICDEWIERCIEEIERDFLNEEYQCVLENVGPKGEFLDHFDGRTLNPGHAIEAGWFILHESRLRGGDARLTALGCKIIDWSWKIGWDEKHGGIISFRDAKGLPSPVYWHDMKFWWPQNETIIATLLAHCLTGDEKYERWHRMAHDWAYAHFPDHEHGEWFGYLHRDGSVSNTIKGDGWKGPFHLPRMQSYCWKLLEEMACGRVKIK